nr:taurine ABC transporter ATP-binding subunit [Pseudogulbenkiania subflava]
MLQVDKLTVHYPGQPLPALQQVSLGLSPDELLVALGPSGCGKSTLLNVLAGFIAPTHGTVQFDGKPVSGPGAERAVVFQNDGLLPWLDVAGNVAFGLKLQGVPAAQRAAIVADTLQQVGLADAGGKRVWELSGGMRQRVGIARALASQSRVLLMDEPFGALDAFTREQMQQLLLNVWQRSQRGVFLITHDIEEALFLATSLVLMSPGPGRIVQYLRPTFSQRFLAGESVRAIKSDPEFITLREELLASLTRTQHEEAA